MTATMQQELSVETAVEEVVRLSEDRGVPPGAVASEVASAINGGPAGEELVRQGLIYLANNRIHKGRYGRGERRPESESADAPSGSGRPPQPGVGHSSEHWSALRRIRLETAEGDQMLPLMELEVSDLDTGASRYRAQEIGARKKADFLERAAKSVRSAGADRIAELSEDTRERLEKAAREAWS